MKTNGITNSCIPSLARCGHHFVFYLSLNVVAVSCVIKEPTFNHEREGRGNFVQEGKSGDLHHRLASVTSSRASRVGVAHSLLIFRTDNKPDQTPTLIVQSIADLCGVHEENTLVNLSYINPGTLITPLKRIDFCAQAHLVIGANHTIFA